MGRPPRAAGWWARKGWGSGTRGLENRAQWESLGLPTVQSVLLGFTEGEAARMHAGLHTFIHPGIFPPIIDSTALSNTRLAVHLSPTYALVDLY